MPILLLATGGTIASTRRSDGTVGVTVSGADLLAQLDPAFTGGVEVAELAGVPSWNFEPAFVASIAVTARDALRDGRASAVVITHGTDTIEETAFLTDLLAGAATVGGPIIVTGAMRNASEVGADGPRNLTDSLVLARSSQAAGRGTLVCMQGQVHAGRWVSKIDSSRLDAFRSPAAGPIGRIDAGVVRFPVTGPAPRAVPVADTVDPAVAVVVSHGHVDEGLIGYHLDQGVHGLVVVGTGMGHVNAALLPGLERAAAMGVPVVGVSRCLAGAVGAVYGGPGGGFDLAARGVIPGGGLGWVRARLALMAALAVDPDRDAVAGWFEGLLA